MSTLKKLTRHFPRLLSLFAITLSLLLTLACTNSPQSAQAAGFTPTSRVIFNDPQGSRSQEDAIIDAVVKYVNGAPKGASIKMAYYWFEVAAVKDAVLRADKRRVEVDILLDKAHVKTKAAKELMKAFRHGGHSKKSSVFYRAHPKRLMHAKFVLISKSGHAKHIAMWGSANLSYKNARVNGNDFRIRVNSPNYGCLKQEFARIDNPKNKDITSGRTCSSKGMLTQFTPVGGTNPWITRGINHIKCSGGTTVRAVIMQWSDVAVAKAFVAKQAQGCDVRLLVNRSTKWIKSSVFKALKATTKHGRVKVYVAKPGHGLHYKWMAVRGHGQAWTMTGSLHPSKGSQHGIQLIVRENGKALANSYLKQFKKLTSKHGATRRS